MGRLPLSTKQFTQSYMNKLEVCVPRGKDSRPGTLVVDAGSRPQSELTVHGWSPQEFIGYLTGKHSTRGGDR